MLFVECFVSKKSVSKLEQMKEQVQRMKKVKTKQRKNREFFSGYSAILQYMKSPPFYECLSTSKNRLLSL